MSTSKIKSLFGKWNSMSDVARASIVFVISSFLLKGINFITTPIFTRLINTTEYGVLAEYNSWQTIIEVFALLSLTSAGVFNVGMKDYKTQRSQYMSSVLVLSNLATLIVFGIVFILKAVLDEDFLLPTNLIVLMLIHFIFSPAQIFWVTRQRYEYKYKLAVIITLTSTLLSQGISVLAVMFAETPHLATVKLWSGYLAGFVFSVPIYFYLLVKGKKYVDFKLWKEVLVFVIPLLPHYLAQHVMSGSDRIMIAELATKADAGIYAVVLNISVIATIAWNSINASLVPLTFENLDSKNYAKINMAILPVLIGYAVFCVFVSLIAPEIMTILAPEEYYSGIYAVPPVVATAFLSALYNVYANIEFYHKKSKIIATATVISAVINIVLNSLLIPIWGFVVAAYTTLISNVILVAIHYFGYRKCHPERVYNDKIILLIAGVCVALCEITNLLYMNVIVRYGFILMLIIMAIINRNRIVSVIRNIRSK